MRHVVWFLAGLAFGGTVAYAAFVWVFSRGEW